MSNAAVDDDRIAAIVAAAQAGTAPPVEASSKAPRVRDVDFARPQRFTPIQMRRIERAAENAARTAIARLSGELHEPVDVESLGASEHTWNAAHGGIAETATCAICEHSSGAKALLSIEEQLLHSALELMLGGRWSASQRPRPLSDIDTAVVRKLLAALVECLDEALQLADAGSLRLHDLEAHAETARLSTPGDATLGIRFELRIRELSSTVSLLLPVDALGDDFATEPSTQPTDTVAAQRAIERVPVTVRAQAGARTMSISDLLTLGVGDIIDLATRQSDGLALSIDGVPVGHALPHAEGRSRAVRVTHVRGIR